MRWWAEFRRPALKCERMGHEPRTAWRRGYQKADYFRDFRAVAVSVRQERSVCARCEAELSPWEEVSRNCLQGLSASQGAWDKIAAGGWWVEHGTAPKALSLSGGAHDASALGNSGTKS